VAGEEFAGVEGAVGKVNGAEGPAPYDKKS